ncbi:hypothetical protein K7X08_022579 [Anisodus acutangulus]|uniref:Uncharacterized protein n=1 Tax=Anisodus acutangulus TaxID=402998 RepID=A0A9Q1MJ98_9SOLA|nr:hypothetical protein K7X08_022579 [Anisodus acutangulus]
MASLFFSPNLHFLPQSSVSAVGHAAMLAAIKKYVPSLIPSPYSSERLDLMKQLKRTKKKEVQARSSIENPSSKVVE